LASLLLIRLLSLIHKQQLEFHALKIKFNDLQTLATFFFDSDLPDGYEPTDGSLKTEEIEQITGGSEAITEWRLRAKRTIATKLSKPEVVQISLGDTPAVAAYNIGKANELGNPPTIILTPRWWPRLPLLPFRIQVVEQGAG